MRNYRVQTIKRKPLPELDFTNPNSISYNLIEDLMCTIPEAKDINTLRLEPKEAAYSFIIEREGQFLQFVATKYSRWRSHWVVRPFGRFDLKWDFTANNGKHNFLEYVDNLTLSPLQKLNKALSSHDWYFEMSDDNRSWASGNAHWEKIKKLMSEVGVKKAKILWKLHAPTDFTFPLIKTV